MEGGSAEGAAVGAERLDNAVENEAANGFVDARAEAGEADVRGIEEAAAGEAENGGVGDGVQYSRLDGEAGGGIEDADVSGTEGSRGAGEQVPSER